MDTVETDARAARRLRLVQAHMLALLQVHRHAFRCLGAPLPRDHTLETAQTLTAVLSTRAVQADHEQLVHEIARQLAAMIEGCGRDDAESVANTVARAREEMRASPVYAAALRRALERAHIVAAPPPAFRAAREAAAAALAHAPPAFRAAFASPWQLIPELYDTRPLFACRIHRGQPTYGPHAVVKPPDTHVGQQ